MLANLALNGLEQVIRERYPKGSQRSKQAQVNVVRYADDFIITGSSKELLEEEVKPLVEGFLAERGLRLSGEKTVITHIEQGFDFLGQTIRKYNGKYLSRPSKKNYHAFMQKVRTMLKSLEGASVRDVIGALNPVIRGCEGGRTTIGTHAAARRMRRQTARSSDAYGTGHAGGIQASLEAG